MGFFTRPDLDDRQFKQLSDATLTLSGETNFKGTLKSKGIEIDVTTGGTYPSSGIALGLVGDKVRLTYVSGDTSPGNTIYTGASPTNITVGGLNSGTNIAGKTLSSIIEDMVVTYLSPTFSSFLLVVIHLPLKLEQHYLVREHLHGQHQIRVM